MNTKQNIAFTNMIDGNNVFITGPGGVGKTHCINQFVDYMKHNKPHHNISITSTTGVSAVILGGCTLHSWAGFRQSYGIVDINDKNYNFCIDRIIRSFDNNIIDNWKTTDTLIIDEISMASNHMIDNLDSIGRIIRCNENPFGGIQIIASGDFLQLPPVNNDNNSDFAYKALIWDNLFDVVIELDEPMRQTDSDFYKLLNKVRYGIVDKEVIDTLNKRVRVKLDVPPTVLFPNNKEVDDINNRVLTKMKETYISRIYHAKISGPLRDTIHNYMIAPKKLELTVNCHVMLLTNLDVRNGLCNGTRGIIKDFDTNLNPIIKFNNIDEEQIISYHTWEYTENKKKTKFSQIPLKLVYASTIHKSQGATLKYVCIDLSPRVMTSGQAYVALSRATSLDGITLTSFDHRSIRVNQEAIDYYKKIKENHLTN